MPETFRGPIEASQPFKTHDQEGGEKLSREFNGQDAKTIGTDA
jgi:hypothetical protein